MKSCAHSYSLFPPISRSPTVKGNDDARSSVQRHQPYVNPADGRFERQAARHSQQSCCCCSSWIRYAHDRLLAGRYFSHLYFRQTNRLPDQPSQAPNDEASNCRDREDAGPVGRISRFRLFVVFLFVVNIFRFLLLANVRSPLPWACAHPELRLPTSLLLPLSFSCVVFLAEALFFSLVVSCDSESRLAITRRRKSNGSVYGCWSRQATTKDSSFITHARLPKQRKGGKNRGGDPRWSKETFSLLSESTKSPSRATSFLPIPRSPPDPRFNGKLEANQVHENDGSIATQHAPTSFALMQSWVVALRRRILAPPTGQPPPPSPLAAAAERARTEAEADYARSRKTQGCPSEDTWSSRPRARGKLPKPSRKGIRRKRPMSILTETRLRC